MSFIALATTASLAFTGGSHKLATQSMKHSSFVTNLPAAILFAPVRQARVSILAMAADASDDQKADDKDPNVTEVVDTEMKAKDDTPADAGDAAGEVAKKEEEKQATKADGKQAEEEEEEEEDLLSSPAFLTQKLKVLESELSSIEEQTAQLRAEAEAQREEWASKRSRLQTDLQNFQTRHKAQVLDIRNEAKVKLISSLLPTLDNFERARKAIEPSDAEAEATNARYLEMNDKLMATLAEVGLEKIKTVGTEFDYNLHMAIQQTPSEEYEEGIVSSEMQTGFTCNGKLVRPAYVMVSSGKM